MLSPCESSFDLHIPIPNGRDEFTIKQSLRYESGKDATHVIRLYLILMALQCKPHSLDCASFLYVCNVHTLSTRLSIYNQVFGKLSLFNQLLCFLNINSLNIKHENI